MDIKKSFEVAKMPVIALIAIVAGAAVIGAVPVLQVLACVIGLPLTVINIALALYIGFVLAKAKMDLMNAVALGAVTGIVAALLSGIISLAGAAIGGGALIALVIGTMAVGLVISIVISAVMTAVFAAIGHFLAAYVK